MVPAILKTLKFGHLALKRLENLLLLNKPGKQLYGLEKALNFTAFVAVVYSFCVCRMQYKFIVYFPCHYIQKSLCTTVGKPTQPEIRILRLNLTVLRSLLSSLLVFSLDLLI